mgnify:CR=1 FL=1
MKKKVILFDLDGTLLPMDQDEFVRAYLSELAKKICPFGYEKRQLVDSVWTGMSAMGGNDGRALNEERFWAAFAKGMGEKARSLKEEFTAFYQNEFNGVKKAAGENPLASEAVALARKRADKVVLATNPLFPACGIKTRLSWVGLDLWDFDLVTTYENSAFCKPNPNYFREILQKIHADPEECLMVGNDLKEDVEACGRAGINAFLVTDCLISHGRAVGSVPKGTFREMVSFLDTFGI